MAELLPRFTASLERMCPGAPPDRGRAWGRSASGLELGQARHDSRKVFEGELVAWKGSEPYFPLVCRRVLNRDMSVPLTFVVFDLLRQKGVDLTIRPYSERRRKLQRLKLDGAAWTTCERFDDGRALFTAVCDSANHTSLYRPNDRGWVKVKNPNYWRRDVEREATLCAVLA